MMLRLMICLNLLLTACSNTPVTDENSSLYVLPVGSTLELHQSLSIRPHRARTFIQYGQIIEEKSIDRYYPYCEFEISTLSDEPQTIKPDQFKIYKVNDNDHEVNRYFMYANITLSDSGGPGILGFATEFYLRSDIQPQVRKLICLHWDEPSQGKYLKLPEIRKTLGNIFSIYPAY
ncbi:MAG: hypothetical protein ACN4GM_07490 [Gammaproteobacteria bacterium]